MVAHYRGVGVFWWRSGVVGTAEMHGDIVETSCNSIMVCSLDSRDHRPFAVPQRFFIPLYWQYFLPSENVGSPSRGGGVF